MNIQLGRGSRALRIGYGRIFHEACAASPISTTREDFLRLHHRRGADLHRATGLRGSELEGYLAHAELTGFRQAARAAGGVVAVPLVSSMAVPGGPLSRDTFDWLVDDLVTSIEQAGALDGVYLALHGSMEVVGLGEAPEAMIIRRVKAAAGEHVKIAVSYDLHGNLSAGLIDPVDVMVAYRSNPHWDLAPTGFRAGNRLIRTLRGHCEPVHAWRKLPMVLGGGTTIDFLSPMRPVFRGMRALEDDPRVLSASLFTVHPFTSADDLGWAAHVCTDGNRALSEELVDRLADRLWAVRKVPLPTFFSVEEGLEEARRSAWRKLGPVTLVDVDDIVGAGAPGGNTHVIQSLVARDWGLRALVPLHDPMAVEHAWNLRDGERSRVALRGTPGYGQPEVTVDAVIGCRKTTDFGRTVRLDCGTFHVAIAERSPLPIQPRFWRDLGINPREADVMVQKNFFHYRMFHATTSFRHIPVVSAGATSFERVRSRAYPVPTFPGVDVKDWRAGDVALRAGPRPLAAVA